MPDVPKNELFGSKYEPQIRVPAVRVCFVNRLIDYE